MNIVSSNSFANGKTRGFVETLVFKCNKYKDIFQYFIFRIEILLPRLHNKAHIFTMSEILILMDRIIKTCVRVTETDMQIGITLSRSFEITVR